jgi:Raf kinase inhibitor-like YbhB/YbcL family protein
MRRRTVLMFLGVVGALAMLLSPAAPSTAATKQKFALTSTTFADGTTIPVANTCTGAGTTPQLAWKNVPKGTKDLALIVEDPDAPSGTFVHWVVANIKPKPSSVAEGGDFAGAFGGNNGLGRPGWQPPCPPPGAPHHYVFTLYALKRKLTLPPGTNATTLRTAMNGKILGQAKLTGLYGT